MPGNRHLLEVQILRWGWHDFHKIKNSWDQATSLQDIVTRGRNTFKELMIVFTQWTSSKYKHVHFHAYIDV